MAHISYSPRPYTHSAKGIRRMQSIRIFYFFFSFSAPSASASRFVYFRTIRPDYSVRHCRNLRSSDNVRAPMAVYYSYQRRRGPLPFQSFLVIASVISALSLSLLAPSFPFLSFCSFGGWNYRLLLHSVGGVLSTRCSSGIRTQSWIYPVCQRRMVV